MIRIAATVLFAAALSTAASAAEKSFPVGGFDRIALGGSPEVTVSTGRAVSVRATGDQRTLDRLDIHVEDGALSIGSKRGSSWSWTGGNYGKVRIAVTVPMIRGVDIGGSGSVAVDRIKVRSFAAAIGGSGSMQIAALETGDAKFSVGGSGSIAAAGRCDSADINVGGSGRVSLAGLKCTTLAASIAGSGGVDANASRTAAVSLSGSGDVRIGGGARCTVSKHGSGTVSCGGNSVG